MPFLYALKRLLDEHPDWRVDFDIRFYCTLQPQVLGEIQKLGLADIIHVKGFCPYTQSLQHQMNASALLLFIAPAKNAEVMLTQKVFEYLRAGRPILAMIPAGACRDLLAKFKEPHIVHPSDVAGIKTHLEQIYRDWRSGRSTIGERKELLSYERRSLARRLASLMDEFLIED